MTRYASVLDLPPQMRKQAERQLGREAEVANVVVSRRPGAVAEIEARCDRGVGTVSTAVLPGKLTIYQHEAPKRTKFGNVRVFLEGEWFDSQLEYDCYCWLRHRKAAGEIAYIKRQVRFVLEGGVVYRADFECVLTLAFAIKAGECSEVWDAKGCDTRPSINKRKQVHARYGVEVRLWKK